MVRPLPPFNARPLKHSIVKRTAERAAILEDAGVTGESATDLRGPLKAAVARPRPELRVLKG